MGTHLNYVLKCMHACFSQELLEAGTGFHLTSYTDRCRAPREEEGGVINDGVSSALFPALQTHPTNVQPSECLTARGCTA